MTGIHLHLERFAEVDGVTLGRIVHDDETLYTMEQPDDGSRGPESCVPAGEYTLEPYTDHRFPFTWALTSIPAMQHATFFIEANRATQLFGCIAVGMSITTAPDGTPALDSSGYAMNRLREFISGRPATLTISQLLPPWAQPATIGTAETSK